MSDFDTFYGKAEVAAILGVHPETVVRWYKAGMIPGRRTLGKGKGPGRLIFTEDDVRNILEKMQQGVDEITEE